MAEKTPQERAAEAAEALAAEGNPVTARAVQQRAQVSMNVASPVAREWNEAQAQSREVPPVPDSVTLRVQGLWREAVEAARGEHQVERDGWAARLASAEEERDGALEDVGRAQAQLDAAATRIAELEALVEQVRATVGEAEARTAAAETRASAAEGVAVGLREALTALAQKPVAD